MNKICTSIEQSQKLIELGIDVNTADMFYADLLVDGNHKYNLHPLESYGFKTFEETKLKTSEHLDFIPAWSLSALMNLLPSEFTTENEFGKYKYEIKIHKYKLADNVDIYQIAYGNYKWYEDGSHSWKDMINTGQKEELLDVAFDMVCWLKKEKYI